MLGRVRGCRAVAGDACGRSSRKARRREKSCAAGRLRRGVRYGAESDLHDRRRYGAGPCDDVADRRGVRQSRLVHAGRERGAHQELFAEQQGDRFRRGRHGAGHGPQDQQQYAGRSARQYGRRVDDGEGRAAGNGDGAGRDLLPAPCHAGSLLCASGLQADARTDRRTAGRERRRCGVRRREALFHRTPGGRNDARRSVADEGIPCDRHPCGRRYDHVGQGRRAVRIQAHALCTQGARRLSSPRRRECVGDSVERRCGAGRGLHARGRGVDDRLRVAP